MKAKIIYLTSPAPDRYLLNFQEEGKEGLCQIEISEAHLANIIADGAHYAFRRQFNRVPSLSDRDKAHDRATSGA